MARRERVEAELADAVGVTEAVAVEQVVIDGDPAALWCARSADADPLVDSRWRGRVARRRLGPAGIACAHPGRCPVAILPAPRRDPDALTAR
jgi:hypothetical protein